MYATSGYIDQSPDALRLTLLTKPVDREIFTCLERAEFEWSDIHVDATVIGASHLVTFTVGDFTLSEVFACVEVGTETSVPLSRLTGAVMPRLPGFRYKFAARQIPWRDPEPAVLQGLVAVAENEHLRSLGIVQEFPKGEFAVTPKTVIVGRALDNGRGVEIQTAHAYPAKGLVLSRSVFAHKES